MQPVVRSLRVLRAVAEARRGISLQSLSQHLGIPIASVHRIVAVLVEEQFLARSDASKRYFIGPAARELVGPGPHALDTPTIVHPALSRLAAETGETVFITELIGNQALCVSLVEGRHPLRLFVRIGQEMPLHAAASARVLLSELGPGQAAALLRASALTGYTACTPRSVGEVLRQLDLIRSRGYDVCDNELDDGAWAVSAPVRNRVGRICAAIALAAPADRFANSVARARVTDAVLVAATGISADIGPAWIPNQRPDQAPDQGSNEDPDQPAELVTAWSIDAL